jgi:2-methylcitrate dehydratase PrpD
MSDTALTNWKEQAKKHRGITMELAGFISGMAAGDVNAHSREVLLKSFIDSIGCALHGLTTRWGRIATDFAREQGGPAESALWGGDCHVSALNAAMAAGTAVHSFDFDDHSRAKIHPGAVIVPAALALGQREKISGDRLLAALAAGYEVFNRVSLAANPAAARMRGWHLTGTCGTFAAAAAAAIILGLDKETTASALGLAGTQSSGVWAFTSDAAMSKRLHPGLAAQRGIMSALMAARGFDGPRYILEAEDGGFLFTMSDAPRPHEIVRGLGTEWRLDGACFKPHACCGSNHAAIDAVLSLAQEHGIKADDIERLIAGVSAVVKTQTGFPYMADSVLNAQMSLQYNLAVALYDGQVLLEQFTPQRIVDPEVVDLAARVDVVIDPEQDRIYPGIYGGQVDIVLKNGRRLHKRVDYSKGMPENPMSREEIRRKFMSLAGVAIPARDAAEVLELAESIFTVRDVSDFNNRLAKLRILAANSRSV